MYVDASFLVKPFHRGTSHNNGSQISVYVRMNSMTRSASGSWRSSENS